MLAAEQIRNFTHGRCPSTAARCTDKRKKNYNYNLIAKKITLKGSKNYNGIYFSTGVGTTDLYTILHEIDKGKLDIGQWLEAEVLTTSSIPHVTNLPDRNVRTNE